MLANSAVLLYSKHCRRGTSTLSLASNFKGVQSFRQTEKSREFICRVTSYFGRMAATGGNVSERYKREHRQIVVGENGQ